MSTTIRSVFNTPGRAALSLALLIVLGACATGDAGAVAQADPRDGDVPLPAAPGWQASLVLDNDGVGVWTVGTVDAFPLNGCPEVYGLDDRGRCLLLTSYSGRWTPVPTIEDGAWLGALARADLDLVVGGPELYVGGASGRLIQLVLHPDGGLDSRVVARVPERELHTFVAGDLAPGRPGDELLLFTNRGEVFDGSALPADPSSRVGGGVPILDSPLADLGARVRQALPLPAARGEAPWIVAVCRTGELLLLRLTASAPDAPGVSGASGAPGGPAATLEHHVLLTEPMGLGRVALAPRASDGGPLVLYVTRDDGVILRLEGRPGEDPAGGAWRRELIYAGPQGPRGVAAGRFDADPAVETLAVFGYSGRVQLLSRRPGEAWRAQDLFVDADKGHWLEAVELDGRNATHELLASGYGGRIVLLARAPGTGLPGVPTDPEPPPRPVLGED